MNLKVVFCTRVMQAVEDEDLQFAIPHEAMDALLEIYRLSNSANRDLLIDVKNLTTNVLYY